MGLDSEDHRPRPLGPLQRSRYAIGPSCDVACRPPKDGRRPRRPRLGGGSSLRQASSRRVSRRLALLALLGLLGSAVLPPAATAAPSASTKCEDRDNNTYQKLLECITLE